MSSYKSCYNILGDYGSKGIVPIMSPYPAETQPEIFAKFVPHEYVVRPVEVAKKSSSNCDDL